MRRKLGAVLLLLWLAALSMPVAAFDRLVIISNPGASGDEFAKMLASRLVESENLPKPVVKSSDTMTVIPDDDDLLVIAIGVQAFQDAVKQKSSRAAVLGVLIPDSSYKRIRAEAAFPHRVSAITLDQPLARQFTLLRAIFPAKITVGALLGADSKDLQSSLEQASKRYEVALYTTQLNEDAPLLAALEDTLASSDVLLALPDARIYSRETAQTILLTSYRHQTPLIGFSKAYVTAGALAAVYSSPEQIVQHTAEFVARIPQKNSALPPAQGPRYFSVAINHQVARSLGITIKDSTALTQYLQTVESGTP